MAKDPAYRDAVEQLRRFTKSGPGRSPFSILLRATALSRAARAVLMNSDLRTRCLVPAFDGLDLG
jgi:hypothetical protein